MIQLSSPPPLEVELACAGLKMLTLFFAVCVGGVFHSPWAALEKNRAAGYGVADCGHLQRGTNDGYRMLHEWISPRAGRLFTTGLAIWR